MTNEPHTPLTVYGARVLLDRYFPGVEAKTEGGAGIHLLSVKVWEYQITIGITDRPMNFKEKEGEGWVDVVRRVEPLGSGRKTTQSHSQKVRSFEEAETILVGLVQMLNGIRAVIEMAFEKGQEAPTPALLVPEGG